MKISLGVIIAIILIVYWYMHDHPQATQPSGQNYHYTYPADV